MKFAKIFPVLALLFSSSAVLAAEGERSCYHMDKAMETEIGFCQAVKVGDTLYISGVAGEGAMPQAVKSVYANLERVLKANGYTFADVVKENVFATDLDAFIKNKELRKPFYGATLPAASWVEVRRLYVPSLVLEVELVAVKRK
jgi:2-iminobutanoate/2-iminopropanoate deaminase